MTNDVLAFTTKEVKAIERFMSALPTGDTMLFGDDGGFAGTFVIEGCEIPPHRIYYDYEFESWVFALTGKEADSE